MTASVRVLSVRWSLLRDTHHGVVSLVWPNTSTCLWNPTGLPPQPFAPAECLTLSGAACGRGARKSWVIAI